MEPAPKVAVTGLGLITTTYGHYQLKKNLRNILFPRLILYGDEIIVDCQFGFVSSAESVNLQGQDKRATNKRD
jgi:hypothetical protein